MFISQNTVRNHVRNILDKLGLRSRNEAVLYAVREGLISPRSVSRRFIAARREGRRRRWRGGRSAV